jgi:AcrR family transcriptional regulator
MPARIANRPRRKAKQDRSRLTVEALLEAAARVLEQRGYPRATTNHIAATAGASPGTLYEYFESKEAVYAALIQQQLEAVAAAIRAEDLDPEAPLHDTLARLLIRAMRAMRLGPGLLRSLDQVPGAVFRNSLAAARQSVIAFIRSLLEEHRRDLRVTDLDLAALMVVSATEGIASNASEEQFDERLAEEIAVLLDLYLTGSVPRPR